MTLSAIIVVDVSTEVGECCDASPVFGAEVVVGSIEAEATKLLTVLEFVLHEAIRSKIEMQTKRRPKTFPIEWL
ncbi:MAG: hypothetical protein L7S47_00280 [Acidimicrobiales bacterium]|nr:hypothetical protein [Acidimicrobiales bacterium]